MKPQERINIQKQLKKEFIIAEIVNRIRKLNKMDLPLDLCKYTARKNY